MNKLFLVAFVFLLGFSICHAQDVDFSKLSSDPKEIESALKKTCTVVYKNNAGEVYQLSTDEYMSACQCSMGIISTMFLGLSASLGGGSAPTDEALSIEQRSVCRKINDEFSHSINQGIYAGTKIDGNEVATLVSLRKVPANELLVGIKMSQDSDHNLFLLTEEIQQNIGQDPSNGISLFSLRAVLDTFQRLQNQKKSREGASFKT